MKVTPTRIPDVLLIEPKVFGDDRGFFFESFNLRAFREATGLTVDFVQDNHSKSARNVLRGLHYQVEQPQGVPGGDGVGCGVLADLRGITLEDVGHQGLQLGEFHVRLRVLRQG